ncbi:hypothetical protein [Romboutsia ilealis]|nr:hypothetical protein [Romboutsia ilealis]
MNFNTKTNVTLTLRDSNTNKIKKVIKKHNIVSKSRCINYS